MWYLPAERNRFTGEPITRTIQARKTIINEGIGANVVVTHPIRVVALLTMTEGNVTIVIEIIGIKREVGTMIESRATTTSVIECPSGRRTRRTTTGRGATRIIITETTEGTAIANGTDVGIVTGKGIGGVPGTTDREIVTETSVRVITKKRIEMRDRGHGRGIARRRRSGR